jgi:hypothetical protein
MSPAAVVLLSALIPQQAPHELYVEQAELPANHAAPVFALNGVRLQITFPPAAQVFAIDLGPAEWEAVRTGRAELIEVNPAGTPLVFHPIPAQPTAL